MFFRGRDSNKVRLELVKTYRKRTDMFDVGIVAWFFFTHEEEVYGPKANRVGFNDFFKVGLKYEVSSITMNEAMVMIRSGCMKYDLHALCTRTHPFLIIKRELVWIL